MVREEAVSKFSSSNRVRTKVLSLFDRLSSKLRGLFKNKPIGPREFDMCAGGTKRQMVQKKRDMNGKKSCRRRSGGMEEKRYRRRGSDKGRKRERRRSNRMGFYRAKNIAVSTHTADERRAGSPKCFSGVARNTRPRRP